MAQEIIREANNPGGDDGDDRQRYQYQKYVAYTPNTLKEVEVMRGIYGRQMTDQFVKHLSISRYSSKNINSNQNDHRRINDDDQVIIPFPTVDGHFIATNPLHGPTFYDRSQAQRIASKLCVALGYKKAVSHHAVHIKNLILGKEKFQNVKKVFDPQYEGIIPIPKRGNAMRNTYIFTQIICDADKSPNSDDYKKYGVTSEFEKKIGHWEASKPTKSKSTVQSK